MECSGIQFYHLPGVVKVAVGLSYFQGWVLFEDHVVDTYGLWRYMPFYRVGEACPWDALAAVTIASVMWARGFRTDGRKTQ